jgi:hypothetical protein
VWKLSVEHGVRQHGVVNFSIIIVAYATEPLEYRHVGGKVLEHYWYTFA